MSLDVTLYGPKKTVECVCTHCDHKHTREERPQFFSANITHSLGTMADEAGIYMHLWRPEEIHITKTQQLIKPLATGYAAMVCDPERFKKLNAANGWGKYENLLQFVSEYLEACKAYPEAEINVSR